MEYGKRVGEEVGLVILLSYSWSCGARDMVESKRTRRKLM